MDLVSIRFSYELDYQGLILGSDEYLNLFINTSCEAHTGSYTRSLRAGVSGFDSGK
jgi:hypothetical protein